MVGNANGPMDALEDHVPTLLFAMGILTVLAAVNTAVVFVNEGYEYQTLSSPLLLLGLLAAILALLGESSRSRDRVPTLAKTTMAVATLALLAVVVLLVWGVAEELGVVGSNPMALALVALVTFIASFALAGVTVVRAGIERRLVGYLFLGEAVMLVLVFAIPAFVYGGPAPEEATIAIELAQAALVLWAGWLVRGSSALKRRDGSVGAREV